MKWGYPFKTELYEERKLSALKYLIFNINLIVYVSFISSIIKGAYFTNCRIKVDDLNNSFYSAYGTRVLFVKSLLKNKKYLKQTDPLARNVSSSWPLVVK